LANNPFCKTLTWVVLAAFLFSTACITTRVITIEPQSDTIQNELKKGDIVNITTKKGLSFKLRITDLSSEAIIGLTTGRNRRELRVLFSEIAKIEQNLLKKGDIVKITTKEGNNFKFKIVKISPGATEGFMVGYKYRGRGRRYRKSDQQQILFSEIAKIEKTEADYNKTVGLIVVVLLIGGLLYGWAVSSTYGGV